MSDFTDLVARAVNPSMSREERDDVYRVVKQALLRLQEREGLDPADPRTALQQHLVEETIRDVEADIGKILSMQKLERAFAAQNASNDAGL
ncbi:hypothetical protein ASG40_04920 [Methylobacterium sp. Leaf399]|uniref:hypothetical protein n=1 Tax=Methylobacterium sp. Leaf399 TaxID=1736364 RepID=UPI0006FC7B77|nr:hypothetical protein [Methylobacterium sp. Leaf399]KQT14661.1 hypothetical protein ASG40_04920 [Methylobacterium sp. Leaf399]